MNKYNVSLWILLSVLYCSVHPNNAAWLKCYNGSLDEFTVTTLDNAMLLLDSPCIDRNLPTVFYTFGYRGKSTGPATTAVLKAYIATKKRNVILLDWEEEAKSGLLGMSLGYALSAVPHSKKVGQQLGDALVQFVRGGLNMTQVHLVGHSLGAHLMSYAGRRARQQGYVVPRITGLDPARALFEGALALREGLDRTSARFVVIVHSDPGGYGTAKPGGAVDIWPNFGGKTQPGCPLGEFEKFSADDLCSHDRSWRYFVEAIGSPLSFPAAAATVRDEWTSATQDRGDVVYLGDLTDTRARGSYYLTTNSQYPYGKGDAGLAPHPKQYRERRNSSLLKLFKYFR
nr:phospholipase A1-like [Metisa plana]